MSMTDWQRCPNCGALPELGVGLEQVFEPADQSIWGKDVIQVQCENCGIYFGTIDANTGEFLDKGGQNELHYNYSASYH